MKVEREITIEAPPERVYELVMDPRRLGDWVTIHESVDDAPDGALVKGSTLKQCLKIAGTKFHVLWTVVEDDHARRVVWEGTGPVHSRARVVYELEPDGSGGTNFVYTNEYGLPGGPLGVLGGRAVAPVSRRESQRTLERLKALLEQGE